MGEILSESGETILSEDGNPILTEDSDSPVAPSTGRWTTITLNHLKAVAHGNLIDKAQSTAAGDIDPIAEAIEDATAEVREACAVSNVLDLDETKVPNSLKGLTARMACYGLADRIGVALSTSQAKQRDRDEARLKRLADKENRIKVALPDDPASSAEMQPSGGTAEAVNVPTRLTGRDKTSGL